MKSYIQTTIRFDDPKLMEAIHCHIAKTKDSFNGYVLQALREKLEREKKGREGMKNTERKVIGTTPDGQTIVEHDHACEWADCAECGTHLDGTSMSAPKDWDGSCWVCGADKSRVGLAKE